MISVLAHVKSGRETVMPDHAGLLQNALPDKPRNPEQYAGRPHIRKEYCRPC